MMQLVNGLDLKNVTLFCQDWVSLIGLRVVTGAPDRFARVVAGNAGLPAGRGDDGLIIGGEWNQPDPNAELKFEEGFMPWLKYSQTVPKFDCGVILQAATVRELTEAELDAYRAPFPDERYAAGPRVMPTLVRSQQATNCKAWNVLGKFDKPFLTTFSNRDPMTKGGEKVFQKRVPGAKDQPHTIIKRAGHFLQEDAPEQLATLINDLIAANPTPAKRKGVSNIYYVEGSPEQMKAFMKMEIEGPIHMLNLLRYKEDGGCESYAKYLEHAMPFVEKTGGRVVYQAQGLKAVIGGEEWDEVLIVEYPSKAALLGMVISKEYQQGMHLRREGLVDSRLVCMQTQ